MAARMMRLVSGVVGVLAALAIGTSPASGAAFVNGGFEADDWSGGFVGDLSCGGGGVTGWTIVSAIGCDVHPEGRANGFGPGPTPHGSQWVILGPYGSGGNYIEQTLTGLTREPPTM